MASKDVRSGNNPRPVFLRAGPKPKHDTLRKKGVVLTDRSTLEELNNRSTDQPIRKRLVGTAQPVPVG